MIKQFPIIIFLADRWFFNLDLLKYIESKNCYYCVRAKANSSVKFLYYDKKEGHKIYKHINELPTRTYNFMYYENLELGKLKFKCNLVISAKVDKDENDGDDHWYIVTNLESHSAIRMYSKRFGAIEMFFKSQKTNGFYLEATKTRNLHAFETLYGIICIAALWINIIGVDYIKNYNHLKKHLNIRFNKKTSTGKLVRILSTFKLGLSIIKKVYNSNINITLKTNFKLYL